MRSQHDDKIASNHLIMQSCIVCQGCALLMNTDLHGTDIIYILMLYHVTPGQKNFKWTQEVRDARDGQLCVEQEAEHFHKNIINICGWYDLIQSHRHRAAFIICSYSVRCVLPSVCVFMCDPVLVLLCSPAAAFVHLQYACVPHCSWFFTVDQHYVSLFCHLKWH